MNALPAIPEGVEQAAAVSARVDGVLLGGVSRLGTDERQALGALVAAVSDTPLGEGTRGAVAALEAGELLAHHLAMIAAARMAIEGARYDALLDVAAAHAGLRVERHDDDDERAPLDAGMRTLMEGARQWLVEIALAGLGQLDAAAITPAVGGLRPLQEHAALARLAALLTGFAHELLDASPTSALAEPPARRWADLWCRAMLMSFAVPAAPRPRSVSGTLAPLGADVRHHDHLLSVVVHGLLSLGDERRLVRTTLSAWKVDAIAGDEIWSLLGAPELLAALAKPTTLEIEGATLLDGGDLSWDGKVKRGAALDPFSLDLAGALLGAVPARDRHPLALAVPLVIAGAVNDADLGRVSPHCNLDAAEITGAEASTGLLRFDDRFSVQPLAVLQKGALCGPAEGIAAAKKVKKPSLAVLRERAGKLLRA
jgi:hypothetical protein